LPGLCAVPYFSKDLPNVEVHMDAVLTTSQDKFSDFCDELPASLAHLYQAVFLPAEVLSFLFQNPSEDVRLYATHL
jgi:hypothetical protein